MADDLHISAGVSQIFEHREAFFVLALTGRTGSGCSTVAKILASESFDSIELPNVPTPPRNHEDRKDRIVLNWLKEHWTAFQTIQVSQIILLFALSKSLDEFLRFVHTLAPNANVEKLREILSPNYERHEHTLKVIHEIRNASDALVIQASEHLLVTLPATSGKIKEVLDAGAEKLYTRIFQALGDNIRRSGNALSDSIDPKGLFILPSAIARIIKLLRLKNRIKGIGRNYFAIDALRHPFEIRYLRERISPFYSVAVSLPMKLADALDLLIAGTQRIVLKSLMLRSIHLRVKTQRNAKKAIRPLYRKIFKHALLAPRSIFVIMALQKRKTSRSYQDRYVGTSL